MLSLRSQVGLEAIKSVFGLDLHLGRSDLGLNLASDSVLVMFSCTTVSWS